MRERNAVQAILQKAIRQADEKNAGRITRLQLAVGELADSTSDSIQSHLDKLSRGTIAEGAKLNMRVVQSEAQCMACFTKYHPKRGEIICPNCRSVGAKILAGEEFFLESIETE